MDKTTLRILDRPAATPRRGELSSFTNHRKYPRLPAPIRPDDDLTITNADGKTQWSASLLNVSAGGIGANCDRWLLLDGAYGVRFPLDFQGEGQLVTARMKAVY